MTTPTISPKIWAGLILIAACIGAGIISAKFYGNYKASQATSVSLKKQNSQFSEGVSTTDSFLSNYLIRQADAKNLNLVLPAHNADMSNFVSNLGQMGQESGVVLSGFQVNEIVGTAKPADNSIQVLSVALTASGTYASLKDFMLRLEGSLRLIDISHIGITSDQNANLQYRINFMTYYQK